MQNSSDSANPTITKLLEVDADLAATEVELSAQLQSIQEKRHSLKTVIDLFSPVDDATTKPVATPAQTPVVEEVAIASSSSELADTTPPSAPADPQPPILQAEKNLSPVSSKQGKKSAPTKKPSQEPNTWQKYVKDEFSDASLAVAVSEVMQKQPKQVLEIATILDSIFTSEIPPGVRSTARERVSNVLSVGAKAGRWYRGQAGQYSISKAAVEGSAT